MACSVVSQLTRWRCICTNSKLIIARNGFPYGLWGYGSRKGFFFQNYLSWLFGFGPQAVAPEQGPER